jgi:HAD superfamily hydrolase (TIGR01549 family)
MIHTLFLDFDGVIVESVNLKTEAYRELFSRYPDHADEMFRYHLDNNALSRYTKFRYIYDEILHEPYTQETERWLDTEFSEIVFRKVVSCPYVRGAVEFLQYFSGKKPIYLVSATPGWELEKILAARNIRKYFTRVLGAPGKKPDHIKMILSMDYLIPAGAIYIGDMNEDLKAARETGLFFVGRQNTEIFEDEMVVSFPDLYGIMSWIIENDRQI